MTALSLSVCGQARTGANDASTSDDPRDAPGEIGRIVDGLRGLRGPLTCTSTKGARHERMLSVTRHCGHAASQVWPEHGPRRCTLDEGSRLKVLSGISQAQRCLRRTCVPYSFC